MDNTNIGMYNGKQESITVNINTFLMELPKNYSKKHNICTQPKISEGNWFHKRFPFCKKNIIICKH